MMMRHEQRHACAEEEVGVLLQYILLEWMESNCSDTVSHSVTLLQQSYNNQNAWFILVLQCTHHESNIGKNLITAD